MKSKVELKDSIPEKNFTRYNLQSPSMERKKEILKEVYERCGQKTYKKLLQTNANEKIINKEISQVKSLMEMNSSRINPNLVDFNETMAANTYARKVERSNVMEATKPKSLEVEDVPKKGF